jgi:hypothetical protein
MSIEKSVLNKSLFFFRTQDAATKSGEALLKLIEDGKLTTADVTTEEVEGKTFIKRNSVTIDLAVPNMAALIVADALTPDQLAHLQAAITQYVESKQKVEVDACTGKVVDWLELFGAAFTQKVAAIKITAEMVKAAKVVMLEALSGGIDGTAYAKPAGLKIIDALFDSRASMASCVQYAPNVLEKVESIITTGAEVLAGADKLDGHADAIDLILTNIKKALAPVVKEVAADDI